MNPNQIWVNRHNKDISNSNMTTTRQIQLLQPNRCYKFNNGIPTIQKKFPGHNTIHIYQKECVGIPSTKLRGVWFDKSTRDIAPKEVVFPRNTSGNNILGDNGILYCTRKTYELQAIKATPSNLAHYNCQLIDENDIFTLHCNQKMHYMEMNIGENYINDYIMNRDLGGGVYLEYHSLPHFHFNPHPQNGGYVILGHLISHNKYELTAFQIPYNKGIYIPPSVIHNDCFLRGNYYVMYDVAPLYSTVLLRTEGNALVDFVIHPHRDLNLDEVD